VKEPAFGGLFHGVQRVPMRCHQMPRKIISYQGLTDAPFIRLPSVPIFYMAHDWRMKFALSSLSSQRKNLSLQQRCKNKLGENAAACLKTSQHQLN
jgi:hypothetical protein